MKNFPLIALIARLMCFGVGGCVLLLILTRVFAGRTSDEMRQIQTILAALDECSPSCFMGITPGVTTYEQSQTLLVAHPWVSAIREIDDQPNLPPRRLFWEWSGAQPTIIPGETYGEVFMDDINGQRIVSLIRVTTMAHVYSYYALLGTPNFSYSYAIGDRAAGILAIAYEVGYVQLDEIMVGFSSDVFCPLNPLGHWTARATFSLSRLPVTSAAYMPFGRLMRIC
ncbi:MAG: hypothetical protein SF029_01080 [bacterium]|nr:hypothetical protein [bacterium]